jgi:hypothetical protein
MGVKRLNKNCIRRRKPTDLVGFTFYFKDSKLEMSNCHFRKIYICRYLIELRGFVMWWGIDKIFQI